MTRKHHRRTRPAAPSSRTRTGRPTATPDTHRSAVIDIPTIVTVLYVDLMGPAEWRAFGPGRLAAYITAVAADPRFRVPELVALVAAARLTNLGCIAAERMAAAEAFAPLVHMEAMANATVGR